MAINIGSGLPLFGKMVKVWGWTQDIGVSNEVRIAHAFVRSGGYSSKHYHAFNWNRFAIISGKLRIDIYRKVGKKELEETIDLVAGDILDVEPEQMHRMTGLDDCHLIETYWTDYKDDFDRNNRIFDPTDIVRMDNGGIKPIEFKTILTEYGKPNKNMDIFYGPEDGLKFNPQTGLGNCVLPSFSKETIAAIDHYHNPDNRQVHNSTCEF